eukprot:COSAG02_NODE_6105_length_3793_cov_6.108684_2_plen_46_part_00
MPDRTIDKSQSVTSQSSRQSQDPHQDSHRRGEPQAASLYLARIGL